jgi:transposase-like protein
VLITPDKTAFVEKLPALMRHSPNFSRNIAIVKSYLGGETMAAIAQTHGLTAARVMQVLRHADNQIGGGVLKSSKPKARNASTMMKEKYPYVWDVANELGLSRQAAAQFYRALGKAGSLEKLELMLADKPKSQSRLTKQIFEEVIRRTSKTETDIRY